MIKENEKTRQKEQKRFLNRCSSRFETFSCRNATEILEFFENFENLAKLYGAKNSDKVRALVELISGPALRVYNKMTIADQQSYREIKSTIFNQLVVQDNQYAARKTYNTRKQNSNESVDEFFTDLQRLATIALHNYSQEQFEIDLMEHFIDGLKTEIRKFIMCIGLPNTLDECLKMAKNVEIANQNDIEHHSRHVNMIDGRRNANKQRVCQSAARNIKNSQHNYLNDRVNVHNNGKLPKRPREEINGCKEQNERVSLQCVDENQYLQETCIQSSHQDVAFRQWPPAKFYHYAGEQKIDTTSPICKNDEKFEQAISSMPSDENRLDNVSTVVNKAVDESATKNSNVC